MPLAPVVERDEAESHYDADRKRRRSCRERVGWIEVICGCMFSGKTEELLRRLRRVQIARQKFLLVKPSTDDRYSAVEVVSHSAIKMEASIIRPDEPETLHVLWGEKGRPPVVGIDEAQFFSTLQPTVDFLADKGARVIVAGLDLDSRGDPFLDLGVLAVAEEVTKLAAVCMVCGRPASRTQRLSQERQRVLVGATGDYEARCRKHWTSDP